MLLRRSRLPGIFVALLVTLGGCQPISAAAPARFAVASSDADYCTQSGGVVRSRYPAYGTNNMAGALRLAGSTQFCEFAAADGSQISIALATLNATEPTLAVLAYLEMPPLPKEMAPGVNPSSVYCSSLDGTDQFGGVGVAGGGWVAEDADAAVPVLAQCVFPDLSMIDSWGLTYHTDGSVRGADLTDLVRFQPDALPGLFPGDPPAR